MTVGYRTRKIRADVNLEPEHEAWIRQRMGVGRGAWTRNAVLRDCIDRCIAEDADRQGLDRVLIELRRLDHGLERLRAAMEVIVTAAVESGKMPGLSDMNDFLDRVDERTKRR